MTAATMSPQPPSIPPRPAKNQDEAGSSLPRIPPRPITKRIVERAISPNPDRFAPSPLHEGIPPKSPKAIRFSSTNDVHEHSHDPIDRSASVPMPSVGEEGVEYSSIATELQADADAEEDKESSASPEQTRTVAHDLKLHAPKPSLSAHSAKQRVQAVTRTDSEKAASFGIGRPSSRNLDKKPSASISANSDGQPEFEDEQGIPEIGQRVPMNPHLGDVQAPSPAPGSDEFKKQHSRKHSSRGGPPGSYGLHGHGVAPKDKLDKAYYEKRPELMEREKKPTPIHDRQNDYAMTSKELNELVRETASRGSGLGTSSEYHATPTDEVGFQASQEYVARITSPPPANQRAPSFISEVTGPDGERTIHVDDPEHPEYRTLGDESAIDEEQDTPEAPILASDEVSKDNAPYLQQPAVHPPPERRGSANEMEDVPSRPSSRPSSRPTSTYFSNASQEFEPTHLDDVKEYEPLFPEEAKKEAVKKQAADEGKTRHHFPSKDVWEDAPNSVHYTAEVSTPDLGEEQRRPSASNDRPKTPAHIFAQQQEELAEREPRGHGTSYIPRAEEDVKPSWLGHQQQAPKQTRPALAHRFPSKDVWEDVPDSHMQETEVSVVDSPKEEAKPEIPTRPAKKAESSDRPPIPGRPKPRKTPSDEGKPRPPVSDKPKPQIPVRPTKSSPVEAQGEVSKPKPPVPSRPVGGKIAALQAGFMSDLNKRLQLGPQAPKKEEPKPQEDLTEEKEKAPLSDARKGRARGPQRRAPARSPVPTSVATEVKTAPTFSFSSPQTFWSIDPDDGAVVVAGEKEEAPAPVPAVEKKTEAPVRSPEPVEKAEVPEVAESPAVPVIEESAEEPSEEPLQEKASEESEAPVKVEKTLVSNTAGESVLETKVEKKDDKVEPVDVEDTPKA